MKKLFIISALLGAMFFTSCEDFLDVNYTKDSPITTSVDQVLPVATFYASQICSDQAWWATVHGVAKESDMTELLNNNIHLLVSFTEALYI